MVSEQLIEKFCHAVAKAEGYGIPDSIPTRARNPGDISDDGDVGQGLIHTNGPFGAAITIYATDQDGWNALRRKIRRMLNGASKTYTLDMTLLEVAIKYSGSAAWATNVAKELGTDTRTTLAQLASDDLAKQGIDA